MSIPATVMRAKRGWAAARFVAGAAAGMLAVLLAAEAAVRLATPADVYLYMGEDSPLQGVYRPDAALGADYRTYADFAAQYPARLRELGALDSAQRPTWLWLGNSFVQAPGMLGDTSQAALPGVRMFYLQRNEPLYLRLAQARALMHEGLRPQRLIFLLTPADSVAMQQHPLASVAVTRRGALTFRAPSAGEMGDAALARSRLALLAWVRWHAGGQTFARQATEFVPPAMADELGVYVRTVGELSRTYGTAATVVLLPNREQIWGIAHYAFQDAVAARCREAGVDCVDARDAFRGETDQASLFVPDYHFSPRGNRLVLAALLEHLGVKPDPAAGTAPR